MPSRWKSEFASIKLGLVMLVHGFFPIHTSWNTNDFLVARSCWTINHQDIPTSGTVFSTMPGIQLTSSTRSFSWRLRVRALSLLILLSTSVMMALIRASFELPPRKLMKIPAKKARAGLIRPTIVKALDARACKEVSKSLPCTRFMKRPAAPPATLPPNSLGSKLLGQQCPLYNGLEAFDLALNRLVLVVCACSRRSTRRSSSKAYVRKRP
mmetsp:Transcript_78914/g.211934  ORF Transcript_78914/g.211934 Transcript_78914/m.211934 type:complete len:211 (-) Transcript_78914:727-1359(-)